MPVSSRYGLLLIVFLTFLLTGCGTTTSIMREMPADSSPNRSGKRLNFDSVQVQIRTEIADSADEAKLLERYVREELVAKNKKIVESDPDAEVVAVIKQLKKVSRAARLWWGSLAGEAEIRVEVRVNTKQSGSTQFIVDSEAKGASSAGGWLTGYGGSTEELMQHTAAAIVGELL